jgi:DNA-binding transcriptional regulator YiaG
MAPQAFGQETARTFYGYIKDSKLPLLTLGRRGARVRGMGYKPDTQARVVVDRELIQALQSEARRRGLGNKSPSALFDLIARAWIRWGDASVPEERPASTAGAAADRLAAIERRLVALEALEPRLAALESHPLPASNTSRTLLEHSPSEHSKDSLRPSGRKRIAAASDKEHISDTSRTPSNELSTDTLRPTLWTPEQLKEAMKRANMPTAQLAQRLKLSETAVRNWTAGKKRITPERSAQLASILGPPAKRA